MMDLLWFGSVWFGLVPMSERSRGSVLYGRFDPGSSVTQFPSFSSASSNVGFTLDSISWRFWVLTWWQNCP